MALKVLLLRKKLTEKQEELKNLERAAEGFQTREAELEADIEAAQTEEERSVVEEAVESFEQERSQNEADQETIRGEIAQMEAEIREAEENARQARSGDAGKKERKDDNPMNTTPETRTRFFGMNAQQRDAFMAREDVKEFLQRTRELASQKRAVNGAELLIPTVVLDLVREQMNTGSKLLKHVRYRFVAGKARQHVMGAVPEAIWTEACGTLNELDLLFTDMEVDAYKVGGFIPICNSTLEDSDIALATEIISALIEAIGRAVDKAILYGTGVKMPLGIVTRLAQTEAPSNYPATARAWANLSATNILTITSANSTGLKLFQNVLKSSGAAKNGGGGSKLYVMNETTLNTLKAEGLGVNAAGVIVSGLDDTMPVVGGKIELLDFIPDDNIIGGHGQRYLLAERSGASVEQSEHVRFIQDQTVFKGTARYDGAPVFAEAFFVIGINGVTPTTSLDFAEDKANPGV